MPKRTRKTFILAKLETNSGTDAAPVAANAVRVFDVTLTPLAADFQDRTIYTGSLGRNPQLVTNRRTTVQFRVEVSTPGGDRDDVPGYGALLQACGLGQTVEAVDNAVAGSGKVEWEPITEGMKTVTIHAFIDGVVQKLVGCVGTAALTLSPGAIPEIQFTFTGKFAAPADGANPAAVYTGYTAPVAVDSDNSSLTLGGVSAPVSEFTFDIANNVVAEDLTNGAAIYISDRAPTGSVTMEMGTVASAPFVAWAEAQTPVGLNFQLGDGDGNEFHFISATAVVGAPTYGDRNGIRTVQLPLSFAVGSGDDEFIIRTN